MTPDQVASVRSTLAAIEADLPTVTARFYNELFARHPEVRALFTGDQDALQQKFAAEILVLATLLDKVDELTAHTADLGRRHAGYGVRAANYAQVRDVLLSVLKEILGDQFGEQDELAWRRMYHLVATAMQIPG